MWRLAKTVALACVPMVFACAAYIKTSGSTPSPDGSLRAAVVVWVGPGSAERSHDVYIGIGDKDDNPATRYFQTKRSYALRQTLEWQVVWLSDTYAQIKLYECADYKGLRQFPDPTCRPLDSLEIIRKEPSGPFQSVP